MVQDTRKSFNRLIIEQGYKEIDFNIQSGSINLGKYFFPEWRIQFKRCKGVRGDGELRWPYNPIENIEMTIEW